MSINSEINRISGNISSAYVAIGGKGGTLPVSQNSANLATSIATIPTSLGRGSYNLISTDNGDGTQALEIFDDATTPAKTASDVTVSGLTVTVAPGLYSTQVQKTASVPTETPSTITSNGTYTATPGKYWSEVTVDVPSSSSKNVQCSPNVSRIGNTTAYTATAASLVVAKTGYYKCSWMNYASANSSTYYLTRLYVGGTATGSTHQAPIYSATSGWMAKEENVFLTAGDTVTVYARCRSGTSYYTVAGMLMIEQQ